MKRLISGMVIGVILSIGFGTIAYTGGRYDTQLDCAVNASKVYVNGVDISKSLKNGIESINFGGTTYLPVRAIAENMKDVGIYYDKKTKRIDINNELYGWKK